MPPATPSNPDRPAATRAETRSRHAAMLDQMLDFGLNLLGQLEAPPGAQSPTFAEAAAGYTAITRSMRLSMMLADKLAEPALMAHPQAAPIAAPTAAQERTIREIKDNITRVQHRDRAESPDREQRDRLETLPDLATCSPEAIIIDICRDLGLVHRADDERPSATPPCPAPPPLADPAPLPRDKPFRNTGKHDP